MQQTTEDLRLNRAREENVPWKKWGPYLSERQWGTVREDYSADGNAWEYFPHDHARSRAYHWGEDGLAGISDDKQQLCFSLALWNGKDPILKERLFGLTNSEGNHGEDVKEYYFYLDSTPTHSYMKYLYKYPQNAYPYDELVSTNKNRTRLEMEYELLDTGIFNDNRYFDVFVEYAKESPEEILIKISAINRGPESAQLHLLPTLLFRNTWSWWKNPPKPILQEAVAGNSFQAIAASHALLGDYFLYCEGNPELLFTENETNTQRIFNQPNDSPYVKDGINDCLIKGQNNVVNPFKKGTKASAHYQLDIPSGQAATVRLRLSRNSPHSANAAFGTEFEAIVSERLKEADEFYRSVIPSSCTKDEALVMRQGLAGMLWSKQYYYFDADFWLEEHHASPFQDHSRAWRNKEWFHMVNDHIISMPDKWEYPWYAAWDLAFHAFILSSVDVDFAKDQLTIMLDQNFIHPSGQLPAYEWNFSDVNPPVHAWAVLSILRADAAKKEKWDKEFLTKAFVKLMMNFTWWVNRKDRYGKNVFEGGFLGLDNIGVFDRSKPLPTGGYLEQADGTAWMALFCQNMLELSISLATYDPSYEDLALKFSEHFFWIASAVNKRGEEGMWDEEDGFYYDLLRFPHGASQRLKVRSLVGLLPFCAVTVIEPWQREMVPHATALLLERVQRMPEIFESIHPTGPKYLGVEGRGILGLVNEQRMRRILARVLDENEFLSPYGIRALSKYHEDHPFEMVVHGERFGVNYLPAESDTGMFGGNSNWRGPIWMPVNALIIRALQQYYLYYGDNFKVECPTGSGIMMNLFEVAQEIRKRMAAIFVNDAQGQRAVFGGSEKFQSDPHWHDCLLFYEYFHGDNGAGIGASHQTGWTGLAAIAIEQFRSLDPESVLHLGKVAFFDKQARENALAGSKRQT